MPEKRNKYDAEFREGAVRIVEETRKPIAQVARDLGVTAKPSGSPATSSPATTPSPSGSTRYPPGGPPRLSPNCVTT